MKLSASMSVFILILLININFQVCKAYWQYPAWSSASASASAHASGSGSSHASASASASASGSRRYINPKDISTSEECARECQDGEPSKICYYHFVLELYSANGAACDYCNVSVTDPRINTACECIIGDGIEKTVMSINRMIPGPSIQICEGDTVIVDLQNDAEGIEATIHWHGIFQNGYQYYDGVPYLTQCPILSANTFRYWFKVKNAGTHFYHSHIATHLLDGQYGSLIVRNPPRSNPHVNLYRSNRGQATNNFLINGRGNWTDPVTRVSTNVPLSMFMVESGKRYRFRLINACSTICLSEVTIENHSVTLIATDGENIMPTPVKTLTTSSGERADFILNANQTVRQYWIHVRGTGECQRRQVYQLAILSYQGASELSLSPNPGYSMETSENVFNPPNSTNCGSDVCVDQLRKIYLSNEYQIPLQRQADMTLVLSFEFFNYSANIQNLFNKNNGEYKRFFVSPTGSHLDSLMANISYQDPPAPLISQNDGYEYICGNEATPTTCTEPCTCTIVYNIPLYAIVDVMTYDKIPINDVNHPFHLHGYSFCVLYAGQFVNAKNKEDISNEDVINELRAHKYRLFNGNYRYCSPKDTVIVPNTGYTIIRFVANNPGWWFFHCHFSWHTATGMNVVFHVGRRSDLPPVPKDFPKCYNWKPTV
ncbi:laccase-5-like isoform X2 [Pseudomyrmex gracilis]|uniref:laccase-5-like isoform X2 n=1 Tax=Pseudomyrmex gracilis TaxID=219809 RepID=UPI000995A8DA|nr:laccase-5-like isoform X2 [Pseudomyrmex gracilis]